MPPAASSPNYKPKQRAGVPHCPLPQAAAGPAADAEEGQLRLTLGERCSKDHIM